MLRLTAWVLSTIGFLFAAAQGEELGSVEGDIILNGEPVAGAIVTLTKQWEEGPPATLQAITDDEGHFKIEQVPPGHYAVGHLVQSLVKTREWYTYSMTDSYRRNVIVGPGEHVVVPPYPKGHTLKGRLVLAPDSKLDVAWQGEDLRMIYSELPRPVIPEALTQEEMQRVYQAHRDSKEYLDAWLDATQIVLDVKEDGSFEARDVPPGEYSLLVDIGTNPKREGGVAPPVAYATFTMPDENFTLPDVVVKEDPSRD